jgi:hypothetical protein
MEINNSQIRKTLGEPIILEFPDYVRKIRTNLIVISIISIVFILNEVKLSGSFFGIKIESLNASHISILMAVMTFYFLFHFTWCSIDYFNEWKIRSTGTKAHFITHGGMWPDMKGDWPKTPRQSTLYNWLLLQKNDLKKTQGMISELITKTNQASKNILTLEDNNATQRLANEVQTFIPKINQIESKLDGLASNGIFSERIGESLKRFDNCFHRFLTSQNMRWFWIELFLPLALASVAIAIQLRVLL